MNSIEAEWQKLRGNLTGSQATDGRRCFYCGVLLVLADLIAAGGQLSEEYFVNRDQEIRQALRTHPTQRCFTDDYDENLGMEDVGPNDPSI